MIELRKRKTQIETDMESSGTETPALYKILPEKATSVGGSMMGSSKVYDISSATKKNLPQDQLAGIISTSIDLTLNPDELEISSSALQSRYEQMKQSAVTEHDADFDEDFLKQNKKKKKEDNKLGASNSGNTSTSVIDKEKNKKYKEFKF
jgi:hypothetical protein